MIARVGKTTLAVGRGMFVAVLVSCTLAAASLAIGADDKAGPLHWYKGCTHAHSLWSDGDNPPEMVVDWYKSHSYQFFALTDHNVLMTGQRWYKVPPQYRAFLQPVIKKYRERFGDDWVELRGDEDQREFRLKTFAEIKNRMEEPGTFLLIQGEEITGDWQGKQVHINALNLSECIMPQEGDSVADTIRRDLLAVQEQASRTGRTILAHINHPNFHYSITAEDLGEVPQAQFVEVCNNFRAVNHYGDADHPGVERIWDVANTIRLGVKQLPPLLGVGSDDAHAYQQWKPRLANPGRAWIVVRAPRLDVDAILGAMYRGDFYASTGVVLKTMHYDAREGALHVEVEPKSEVNYTIEFVGTLAGILESSETPLVQSPEVGKLLARHQSTSGTYRLAGEELYVRAHVLSDRKLTNPPSNAVQYEQAWTQPVGWEKRLPSCVSH